MEGAVRTLVLFALAGGIVSLAAWLTAWRMDPRRRLRRAVRRVLGVEPDAEAVSPSQGRAAALDVAGGGLAVLWDRGESGLVYQFQEIEGAELIVDGQVRARVRRGEPSKPLDHLDPLAERVALRLMFDTPRWPEFELDLQEQAGAADEAAREGRRWLAHVQTLLRRVPPKPDPAPIPDVDEDEDEDD